MELIESYLLEWNFLKGLGQARVVPEIYGQSDQQHLSESEMEHFFMVSYGIMIHLTVIKMTLAFFYMDYVT